MKKGLFYTTLLLALWSCSNESGPDVSGIKVDATINRFDKDFFSMDTSKIEASMDALETRYSYFVRDFVQFIVLGSAPDSVVSPAVRAGQYFAVTKPLYDSIRGRFENLSGLTKDFEDGFKHVKYYFPAYKLPKIVTYSGLIGDPSVGLTKETLIIGLQMFAGRDFGPYNTLEAQQVFPLYISRRFEPEYILPNSFQNIAMDIYPLNFEGKSLVDQMVEKGKQWYLLDKFLPKVHDTLKTGYAGRQLTWVENNEGVVWNFLLKNTDLYTTDQNTVQSYLGEAPKTEGMPDDSPGNIGQWIGWQIVKAFAEKNEGLSPEQIMQTDARKIFEGSKYKPR
ncbi:MAG: hypothetical protein H7Y27_09905 [Gemmatimonadaceae bacterium]|nr:hypothetical protein [Chitinophagaceae bacterium]